MSAFLGGVSLNNPSACDATNTHTTQTTVEAFPFHGYHSPCGHCKCKIRWTNVSHILGTNYLQWKMVLKMVMITLVKMILMAGMKLVVISIINNEMTRRRRS